MALPNLNPNNKIKCLNDLVSSIKSFVFGGSPSNPTMEIIQGANTLLSISLKDLFITLDNFSTQDFILAANDAKIISACNTPSNTGEVQFIAILVTYPDYDDGNNLIDTEEKYIKFEYPEGSTQFNLGKIMILSGSTKTGSGWDLVASPGGIRLFNPHLDFDVAIKVLTFN